jgi:hypothetical protein
MTDTKSIPIHDIQNKTSSSALIEVNLFIVIKQEHKIQEAVSTYHTAQIKTKIMRFIYCNVRVLISRLISRVYLHS